MNVEIQPKAKTSNDASDEPLNSLVKSLLHGFSVEITTKEAHEIAGFQKLLPVGTEVYIVATTTTQPNDVVQLATRLHHEGMIPVPHIAARAIPNISAIDQWLYQLKREAYVDRALVIAGGSYDKPLGPFASSLALIESNVLIDNGITDIRFAAHPEGHPLLTDSRLFEILAEKQAIGEKLSLKTSLVTQFFFDFEPVAKWERKLIGQVIQMPIRVGFHGIVGIPRLIRHAQFCGIGESINKLKHNPYKWLKTAARASPEKLILGLAKHCEHHPDNLFSGCHFFPFGNFEETACWLNTKQSL